ncbi:histidinol phosphate phosphatase H [Trametes coccinea BRFM310]|uniref:Histidinol-phosphatase n=1 Tax=Trametes coccinea (strain BRFM310) TaxID=1353009 RepID=A0A1Y2IJ04_TRAC3|nr:histidinol phosphate phosphatase H [Trametes coccinea BRFM310]
MPHSHHSHSGEFCKHAAGTLEEVVLEAIRQGFETFGLTEHVPRYRAEDLYPEEAGMPPDALRAQFTAFLAEAHRLKATYADRITLLVGAETEYITPADLDALDALLRPGSATGAQIEFLVGSVHHVNGVPIDFDRATYERALETCRPPSSSSSESSPSTTDHATLEAFLCAYLDAQHALLARLRPELVGHLDLCRLYTPTLRFADFPAAHARLRRNVALAVSYGAVFELNAAAFRKGWDSAYPGADVVEVILQAGGRFVLSDDSHGPHAVGLNYHRIPAYARRVGITELWVLERARGEERNAAGRAVVPRRVEGDWLEHPFWRRTAGNGDEDARARTAA